MSLVIVGTDTEVGKTVVSAVLAARFADRGEVGYWKPVASGAVEGRDTETVRTLAGAGRPRLLVYEETYLFDEPLSPHLAARLEGRSVEVPQLQKHYMELAPQRQLIIEGVGGLLVPLRDDGYLLTDFLCSLSLPCLLVARSTLGTINHTLLSLEALRRRGLEVAGVVLNGPRNDENRRAIERYGEATIVGELEPMSPLDAAAVTTAAEALDPVGHLDHHLLDRHLSEPAWKPAPNRP